ncbi:MAG: hypothetical protein LBP37_04495 [Spirochaetaceae bacterium]|jgi:hypothetical protein|nr:hypothetical protein [Spirochaetaceae bacterium]
MYLDPGFGSMVIQALVGLIAVAGTSFYMFRQKIKALMQGWKNKDHAAHDQNPQ